MHAYACMAHMHGRTHMMFKAKHQVATCYQTCNMKHGHEILGLA